MFIQANTKVWDAKFKKCKTPKQRSKLMLSSGTETASIRYDMKTHEEFYRPAIGKFTVHGIDENDDFKYKNIEDAINKGKELRQQLVDELTTSNAL